MDNVRRFELDTRFGSSTALRGELAALQLGGKQRETEQLLYQHREALFGVHADSWLKTLERA